jgi:hypothetical protein
MHSFESEFLEKQSIPRSLLRTVRILGEHRGKEALFMRETPQVRHGGMSVPRQGCYMGEKGIMNPLMGSETAIAYNSEPKRDVVLSGNIMNRKGRTSEAESNEHKCR